MTPAADRLFRQQARRLMRAGSFVQTIDDGYGLFVTRNKAKKPVAHLEASLVEVWCKADLLTASHGRFTLSQTGRAYLHRGAVEKPDERFMAQHQLRLPTDNAANSPQKNVSQTALDWLKHRGKRSGFSHAEFEAGFRFQADYEHCHFVARTGMDWSRPVYVDGGRGTGGPDDISAHVLDARKKFRAALAYLGPGLADMALSACCQLQGLEACEEKFNLPKRSGKMLLKLALMRLSVYYKIQSASVAAAAFRMR